MDSLKKRYLIKLASTVTDALIKVLMLLFVPRVLGPAAFGNFNFIRDTLQSMIAFSDLNLGSAHINYSARKKNTALVSSVYYSYTMLIGGGVLVFISVISISGLSHFIFPGQNSFYIYLGGGLAYLMYLYNAVMGLSDSKGVTYGFEMRSMVVSVLMFCVLLVLYFTDRLNLTSFFIQRILLNVFFLGIGLYYLRRSISFKPQIINLRQNKVKVIIRNFFSFSHPLIILSAFGVVFAVFDRWFLQIIYGSVTQGFFSLAFYLSSIAGLFLAPMTPLLLQTVAKADESGDIQGIKEAFDKVKILYLIGAFISIFFIFHSDKIIALIGGNEYDAARSTVMIMFVYPIQVVYGQFCGGVLIAMRKTAVYRDINLVCSFLGIFLTYFMLAPSSFIIPGLELGSMGLALKLILSQLFSVTVQLYFVCKAINENMLKYVFSQLLIPIPIILIGASEWLMQDQFTLSLQGSLVNGVSLVCSMMLWTIFMGGVIWRFPRLVGLSNDGLRSIVFQTYSSIIRKQG